MAFAPRAGKEHKLIVLRTANISVSVAKGQGALPASDALEKLAALEAKQTRKVDVVVMTGGLHYLQLWPAVKFEAENRGSDRPWFRAAEILSNYSSLLSASIHAVRRHVGPQTLFQAGSV